MGQNGDHASEGLPARPREELHNLAKNIADCTELHLARRGITHLADMEAFESLEVLWVNDNSLSRISSLDYNPTIKSLYAHNNRIGTLKGSLPTFTFVHTVTLGNNRIGNLQASLKILRLMRHLRYLELSGNPLAEETGYRLLVIKAMPWLEMLDMHRITDSERSAARRTRVPKSWQASARESHGDSVRVTQDLAAKEAENDIIQGGRRGSVIADAPSPEARPVDARRAKALLHQELSRMSAIVKHRRILLKEWFVAEDVRREEAVTQDLFIRCLRLHGLWPDLGLDGTDDIESAANAHSPPYTKAGFLSGNVGLVAGILLEAFQTPTPRRAVALGRDPAYLEQSFVDYVSFCGAVEPKTGGRDLDNQSRVLDKAWKAKPKESRSGGKPRLESLKAGSPDRGDRDGGRESTETERRETAVLLPTRAPMACEFTKSHTARGPARLDHWERIELKRILEAVGGGDVGKSTPPAKQQLLTREQVFAGLEKMVTHGRRPRVFAVEALLSSDDDSINNLSRSANGGGGGGSSLAAATDDTGLTNLDVFFDAAVALSSSVGTTTTTTTTSSSSSSGGGGRSGVKANGGGSGGGVGVGGEAQDTKADVGVLLRLMEEGLPAPGGVAPLEWEWLSCEEAGERARKFYREAAHAQRRLLLISDGEDEPVRQEAARIRSKIATLTRNAARLDTLASSSLHASSSSCSLYPSDGGDHGAGRARGGLFSASSPLGRIGRVDVYVATDFHGRPFQEQEDSGNRPVHEAAGGGGAAATAAASVSRSCNTSLASSISLGPAEKGPVVGGGGGGGEGGGEGGVKVGTGRPWFSRHVLTTG